MLKVTMTTTRTGPRLTDAVTFPIACPECGHETEQPVSRLQHDPTITCLACSYTFKVDTGSTGREVMDKLKKMDRLLDNFGKR